jgi:hypothetical protein
MATGRLGTQILSSGTIAIVSGTPVYTVLTGNYAVFNVSFTNQSPTASVQVRLAVATTTTPATSEYLEYFTTIAPNGVFERTGLVAQSGLNIMASSNGTAVSVNVYGIETSTS